MKKTSKSISCLIPALVAALLVGAAVYFWQQSELKSALKPHQKTDEQHALLEIPELGAKIKLSSTTKDLMYQVEDNYQFADNSVVSAVKLGTTSSLHTCIPGYLGFLIKVKGTLPNELNPTHTILSNGQKLHYFARQYNGFYIKHVAAQNGCQLPDGSFFPSKPLSEAVIRDVYSLEITK